MEDINKMTLGDIQNLVEKKLKKVYDAHYNSWDHKNMLAERLQTISDAVDNIQLGKDYILDDQFLDGLIENL